MNSFAQGKRMLIAVFQYAVKILHKADMTDNKHVVRVRREIRFLRLLHHPHIVKVRDVFESPKSLFIVMERFTGGELFDYIVNHGRVKEKESRRFFRQIISAVEYCHQVNDIDPRSYQ